MVLLLDLEDYKSLPTKVVKAILFFGSIDVLVNNEGIHPDRFAKLILKAIKNQKEEVYIVRAKEKN
ncbi:hypothetical protein TSEDIMI_120046 [Tenacibaculum sediminilitoris]